MHISPALISPSISVQYLPRNLPSKTLSPHSSCDVRQRHKIQQGNLCFLCFKVQFFLHNKKGRQNTGTNGSKYSPNFTNER